MNKRKHRKSQRALRKIYSKRNVYQDHLEDGKLKRFLDLPSSTKFTRYTPPPQSHLHQNDPLEEEHGFIFNQEPIDFTGGQWLKRKHRQS